MEFGAIRDAGFGAVVQGDFVGFAAGGSVVGDQGIAEDVVREGVCGKAEAGDILAAVFLGFAFGFQGVGDVRGFAVLHLVQAEVFAGNFFGKGDVNVETFVVLFIDIGQADAERLIGRFLLFILVRLVRGEVLHGRDGRVVLFTGQGFSVDGSFLGQIVVVHRADHGAVVFRCEFSIAGGRNGQNILLAVCHVDSQDDGDFGLLQDPEGPTVFSVGQADHLVVGGFDAGDVSQECFDVFIVRDFQGGQDFSQRDILRTGKFAGIGFVFVVEYHSILQDKFAEVRGGEGESADPGIFAVDFQSVVRGDRLNLNVVFFIRVEMIKGKGHVIDHGVFFIQKNNRAAQLNIHVVFFGFSRVVRGNFKSSKTGKRIRYRLGCRTFGSFGVSQHGGASLRRLCGNLVFQFFQPLIRKLTDREIFRRKRNQLCLDRLSLRFRFRFFFRFLRHQNDILVLNRICHLVPGVFGHGDRHVGEHHDKRQQESNRLFQFQHLCNLLSAYPSVEREIRLFYAFNVRMIRHSLWTFSAETR